METSCRAITRKLRGANPVNYSIALEQPDVRDWIAGLVAEVLAERKLTLKEAAVELRCSPRTLENLYHARNGVSVELLRDMSRCWPETRPAIKAFFNLAIEIDAETEKLIAKIQALAARSAS